MPSRFPPIAVYLDANVLYSASDREKHRFLQFWQMHGVTPATSMYALGEVRRNIRLAEHHRRFDALLQRTMLVSDGPLEIIPPSVRLVPKDRAILAAAIHSSVDYLVTGDINHFGHLYGTTISHIKIVAPTPFLNLFSYRLELA
ncbi:MAG: PIN domain-containing protein [Acidobacteriota bacterium]